jgi:hypothetical protein
VRRVAVLIVVVLAGCGGSTAIHYHQKNVLACVRETSSRTVHSQSHGVFVAFTSPDGGSAIEGVAVAFAPSSAEILAESGAPTRLGVIKPDWTQRRGDAEVWGIGPLKQRLANRQRVPDVQARVSAKTLDAHVRLAIERCLKQNER